jgi:amidophosphoribosyltransferase
MIRYIFCIGLISFLSEVSGCGLALVRLRKPLSYYHQKYGTYAWGASKLCELLEAQYNRGQDGAGIATMQYNMPAGSTYLQRIKNAENNAIDGLVNNFLAQFSTLHEVNNDISERDLKHTCSGLGEVYLGHVRYGTHSNYHARYCQPYICKNSIAATTFALAGNFNMTNTQELYEQLLQYGLAPTSRSDTQMILESISYFLKHEYARVAQKWVSMQGKELVDTIAREIDLIKVISQAAQLWDGGYVLAGIVGNGDAFVCRDPAGIRPGFFYVNDEVIAVASERTALMNVFSLAVEDIEVLQPGQVLLIKNDATYVQKPFIESLPLRECSFERIYFSRSNDPAIYQERKALGKNLAHQILNAVDYSLENVLFTYVPNSSEVAFIGLIEELNKVCIHQNILKKNEKTVRVEKLIHKNQRLRTFITSDKNRTNCVAKLYSTTKGIVKPYHTLVVIDDSIVRGTTLRESLLKELIALNPARIIFVSSAPPILYPDCYGIDMSQLGRFIAFQAAVALLKEQGQGTVLKEIYDACKAQKGKPAQQLINYVQKIYEQFTADQLSTKIAELVRAQDLMWKGDIQVIYQTLDGLHNAMPEYTGDWYFTGLYPTPGGLKVLNTSYIQWYEGSDARAY